MKPLSLLCAALSLALPLLSIAEPAAGASAIAQAAGDNDPFVVSWVDTAEGKLSIGDKISAQIHDLFAGVRYILTDDGQFLIGHLKGNDLALIAPRAAHIHNDQNTYFVIHTRSADKTIFLDGSIIRYKDDPSRGYAEFTLLVVGKQGETISSHIEQDLQFAGGSASPGAGNDILDVPSG